MPDHKPAIFISYRGTDVAWAPDFVYSELAKAFGAHAVFKAGASLRAGQEYPPILEEMATSCPVMVVCIGPKWLAAKNSDGTRRLDDTHDWVRREIELALRNGNHVVPLLLGNFNDISIPAIEDLPADIAPLAHRQAFRLEPGGRLQITVPALVAQLTELVPGLSMLEPLRSSGPISATVQIGSLRGKAFAVRATEGAPHRIDTDMKIIEVAETGEATGVDLSPRDRG